MATFDSLMQGFGILTVMNARIYKMDTSYTSKSGAAYVSTDWTPTGEYLDTLKIANITQEGPTKTVTGGQYANPLIKYGKTATMEMQDALGRASTLVRFFGCEYQNSRVSITDKFPGPFAIEGETFFIDQKSGDKVTVYIFIPQFTPDAILTLTQDAEGDATVFDLNGSLGVTKIDDGTGARDVFYEIRETSFFKGVHITNKLNEVPALEENTGEIQLHATLTNITGDITWETSDENKASVDENGLVKVKSDSGVGKFTITASVTDNTVTYTDTIELEIK